MDKYYRTNEMMTPEEKKEYLKKYLSSGSVKKKKKVKSTHGKGTRIVDDDVVAGPGGGDADDSLLDAPDERPQVVSMTSDHPVIPSGGDKRWKTLDECDLDELESQRVILSESLKRLEGSGKSQPTSATSEEDGDAEESSSPAKRPEKKRHDSESSGSGEASSESESESEESDKDRKRDSDDSAPRRRTDRSRHDSDNSPVRKRTTAGRRDSDESPPRRRAADGAADSSAKRQRVRQERGRHEASSDDQSPPRSKVDKYRDSDETQVRRVRSGVEVVPSRTRHDSDPSPPRRRVAERDVSAAGASHRRSGTSAELSGRQAAGREDDRDRRSSHRPRRDSDASPPRRSRANGDRAGSGADSASPPRSWRRSANSSVAEPPPGAPPTHTMDGRKAGLQDISALREENRTVRRWEQSALEEMDDSMTGRHAETKVRGRKLQDNMEKAAKKAEEEAKAAERKKKYDAWGRGLKQAEEQRARAEHHQHEAAKPLARYADDRDLENELRQRQRQDDPMAEYIQRKRSKQAAPLKERPRYNKTEPPPNRYGIWPGYRWDGVDRSNGFEKALFLRRNARKARDADAYKWSTEDM